MSKEKPTSPFLLERRAAFVTVGANIMQAGHVHPTVGNVKVNYIRISAVDVELFALSTKGVFAWRIRRQGDGQIAFKIMTTLAK
ncbi:MAG TPA: hypothetical protein VLZ81_12485 [Blastocatellia bacterium]|nr:hypothetical protein [Blastocatellia bacterium]